MRAGLKNLLLCTGIVAFLPAASAQDLVWQATPLFGTITVNAGFDEDPRQVAIQAGGRDRVPAGLGAECRGLVNSRRPDVDFNYLESGRYMLFLYVLSLADTTLVVYTPDGRWLCNDDGGGKLGLHPLLSINDPPSGNYNIWVGVVNGASAPATLYISERNPRK